MSEQPWMPLYVGDFLTDTLDLKADEIGIYMLLLMLSWKRDGSLPNDMKVLKLMVSRCVSDMHGNRFNRLVPKILERYFYIDDDGTLRNKRLTKEWEKSRKISGKQTENIRKRWAKHKKTNDIADTTVIPLQSQLQEERKEEDQKVKGRSGEPSVIVSPLDPVLNGSMPEWRSYYSDAVIAELQFKFDSVPVEDLLPELWEWSGTKAEKINERMKMVFGALRKRHELRVNAPKLLAEMEDPPSLQPSEALLNSKLVRLPHRRAA